MQVRGVPLCCAEIDHKRDLMDVAVPEVCAELPVERSILGIFVVCRRLPTEVH